MCSLPWAQGQPTEYMATQGGVREQFQRRSGASNVRSQHENSDTVNPQPQVGLLPLAKVSLARVPTTLLETRAKG